MFSERKLFGGWEMSSEDSQSTVFSRTQALNSSSSPVSLPFPPKNESLLPSPLKLVCGKGTWVRCWNRRFELLRVSLPLTPTSLTAPSEPWTPSGSTSRHLATALAAQTDQGRRKGCPQQHLVPEPITLRPQAPNSERCEPSSPLLSPLTSQCRAAGKTSQSKALAQWLPGKNYRGKTHYLPQDTWICDTQWEKTREYGLTHILIIYMKHTYVQIGRSAGGMMAERHRKKNLILLEKKRKNLLCSFSTLLHKKLEEVNTKYFTNCITAASLSRTGSDRSSQLGYSETPQVFVCLHLFLEVRRRISYSGRKLTEVWTGGNRKYWLYWQRNPGKTFFFLIQTKYHLWRKRK